ncbi:DUF115 domain-containing protein [Candidatus Dojkabacteria bacterium]|jgi:hypothetical protein|nr:DUF115 domain-containing protein [Candidatus Dojkabacteria bacterium]
MKIISKLKNVVKGLPVVGSIFTFVVRRKLLNKYKGLLEKNLDLKNKYKGKRCFILGNGPSLKNQNQSGLQKEIVFTVNWMMKSPLYEQLKPKFHVIVDSESFKFDVTSDDGKELVNEYRKLNTKEFKPTCIFSVKNLQNIKKFGLDKFLDIRYVLPALTMNEDFKKEINMCGLIPSGQNVIHTAIYCAIYMGFTEIYLLGCDMTGFMQYLETDRTIENNEYGHVYKYSENYKKFQEKLKTTRDNEFMITAYSKTFQIFKAIRKYADSRSIKIINLTKGGILDVFPKQRYEDIIKI